MGQGESSFYPVHGHNVYLRDNGSCVERATDSRTHAIAFTKRSLELNGLFQIKILVKREEKKKKHITSQVVIGITTQNPSTIKNLPKCSSLYELQRTLDSDYWCIEFVTNSTSKVTSANHQLIKIQLVESDVVGLMLTKSGYVHLLVNGVDQEVLWNNLPTETPLWGVLELNGTVTCIKAEYKSITTFTVQQDKCYNDMTSCQLRPLPPLPDDTPITLSLSPQPHPPLASPIRSPKNGQHQLHDIPPLSSPQRSPVSFRRPLPGTPPTRHSTSSPTHFSPSPPRSPAPPPRSLVSLTHRQPSLDNAMPTNNNSQIVIELQRLVREQNQQISDLEKERDEQKETKEDLQQQIDILRMQLITRQKSHSSPMSPPPKNVEPQSVTLPMTTPSNLDISFWEISSLELKISDEILGRGGWGEVRRGEFRGTQVAVKKLYSEILSPYYVSLVRREISMMAKVRHPNLVLFIGASLDDSSSSPMIILELLGDSLRQAYQQGKLESLHTKLTILRDAACALNYLHCHSQEIIHRDVSSANVLLEPLAGGVFKGKLSDFGSANLARLAVTAAPGAEVYTAPEVPRTSLTTGGNSMTIGGAQQTTKIDVYSFGVLLCEVIAGQFPLHQAFEEMLQEVSQQSVAIRELVNACISIEPNERPTMNTVLEQLTEIMTQL